MYRFVSVALILSVGTVACSSTSQPKAIGLDAPLVHQRGGHSVRLVREHGGALPVYQHDGRTFVEGRLGERFGIEIRNDAPHRVEAVVTVDGRDVISGNEGDYTSQRGYIIEPHDTLRIDGFRQSFDDVAAFRFAAPEHSYTARRGTPDHVGVVGVAIFGERAAAAPAPIAAGVDERRADVEASDDKAESSAPAAVGEDMAPSPRRERRLGTAWGERLSSRAFEVPYQRAHAASPDALLAVYYDDYQGLVARGVIPVRAPYAAEPEPFPRNRNFAPPPR